MDRNAYQAGKDGASTEKYHLCTVSPILHLSTSLDMNTKQEFIFPSYGIGNDQTTWDVLYSTITSQPIEAQTTWDLQILTCIFLHQQKPSIVVFFH